MKHPDKKYLIVVCALVVLGVACQAFAINDVTRRIGIWLALIGVTLSLLPLFVALAYLLFQKVRRLWG